MRSGVSKAARVGLAVAAAALASGAGTLPAQAAADTDDVAVTGANVTATAGKTVQVTFGVTNKGTAPTALVPGTNGVTAAVVLFFPHRAGGAVKAAPKGCAPAQAYEQDSAVQALLTLGAQQGKTGMGTIDHPDEPLVCLVDKVLQPGESASFTFGFQWAAAFGPEGSGAYAVSAADDADTANNGLHFTVLVKSGNTPSPTPTPTRSGTGTPSPTATHTPGRTPSAAASPSATGPGLADTGGGSSAVPYTLGALTLIAAGATVLGLTRRGRRA